jgi:carboxyl-terminal processing protease
MQHAVRWPPYVPYHLPPEPAAVILRWSTAGFRSADPEIELNTRKPLLAALLVAATIAACADARGPDPAEPRPQRPHPFLLEVLGVMQHTSVNRNLIDWELLRADVIGNAGTTQYLTQTYGAIMHAMSLLDDPNAQFQVMPNGGSFAPAPPCHAPYTPAVPMDLPLGIGYVHMPSFNPAREYSLHYMTRVRNEVVRHDRADMTGWIIDLRGNTEGELWPLVAAIGPLLGEGVAGHFIDANGGAEPWGYERGAALLHDRPLAQLEPYELLDRSPRIAVLLDESVAGPGEALAVAFRARENVRFFGRGTCGRAMHAERTRLSNGAILTLSTALMADRTRTPAARKVTPDEVIVGNSAVVERAVAWLRSGEQTNSR